MPGTFYVAGAGISGLTLALALAKFGARIIVLERSDAVSEFGAGLQISPNARKVLDSLGLDEALSACSLEPTGLDIYPHHSKRPLVTMELGGVMRERFGAPYAVMHRADLADILYKATRRFANIEILFGVKSWSVASHTGGVTVSIEEANGQNREGRGDALIGADGVHSQTRREVLGGPPARYRNRIAWRALVPFEAVEDQIALDRVSVLFAPGYHMVCYPLPHRSQVNCAFFAKAPEHTIDGATVPISTGEPSPRVDAILSAGAGKWTPWPLYTVETDAWHRGNVGLIGDAAHAMVPFQAQGAAMGIEDAAILAPLLATFTRADEALAQYEKLRKPRVTRVARASTSNGMIFHLPWPLTLGRNMVIASQGSRGHVRRLAWLYGYDASGPQSQ